MSTPTSPKLAYAIVRAGFPSPDTFHILYVHTSLEKAHASITTFAQSSGFSSVETSPPTELRELDGSVPAWWKGYHLFEGYFPVGRVYIEVAKLED